VLICSSIGLWWLTKFAQVKESNSNIILINVLVSEVGTDYILCCCLLLVRVFAKCYVLMAKW
jgi:hypothetical protein